MKKVFGLFLLLCCAVNSGAATSITTSSVSGHWTLTGSPYKIYNDIQVDSCSNLIIDPGVEIIFQGFYAFKIYGTLRAVGTASQQIRFHANDTTGWHIVWNSMGGWKGINWEIYTCAPTDSSAMKYCDLSDMKSKYLLKGLRGNIIEYCNLHHNIGSLYYGYPFTKPSFEISHCSFYESMNWIDTLSYNCANLMYFHLYNSPATIHIHDCKIYNNFGNMPFITIYNGTLLFEKNDVYGNVTKDSSFARGTIFIDHTKSTIQDNKIYNNIDAMNAPIHSSNSNTTIERNYICNNQSINGEFTDSECGGTQGGGGIRISCTPDSVQFKSIIRNNIVANNFSGFGGGGIYIINANVTITNNHIINNSGFRGGGITFNNYPSVKHTIGIIKNNIFNNNVTLNMITPHTFENADTFDVWTYYADTVIFQNNWIKGSVKHAIGVDYLVGSLFVLKGDTTTNVIGVSPEIVAPTLTTDFSESALTANFSLFPTSACVNKGDTVSIIPGTKDYLGNNRVSGSNIDIGAFEYGPGSHTGTPVIIPFIENPTSLYPNPASNIIFISTPEAKGIIDIVDVSGKQVVQKNVTSTLTSFDIHAIPRGIYFAIWNDGKGIRATQKVVAE